MPLNIEFKTYEELLTFIYSEKSLIFSIGYEMIKKSILNFDEIAVVANLSIDNTVLSIEIKKNDWKKHLNTSLHYFENLENYEMCQNIKDLLDSL